MASRIQPKQASAATTGVACLVGAVAWILISSIYVGNTEGWPQFVLSAFAAASVCAVAASALAYAAHQQYVAKSNLFADHCSADEFDYRSTGQWAVVTGATDGIGKEYARQLAIDHGMDVLLVGRNPDKLRAVAGLIRKESAGRRRVMTVVADFAKDPVARNGTVVDAGQPENSDQPEQRDGGLQDDDVGDRCFCDGNGQRRPARRQCPLWYGRLRAVIEGRLQADGGVGVLVNCAGVSYPYPEFFAGMTADGNSGSGDGDGPVQFTADFCGNADVAVRCNVAGAVHACRLVLPGMLARGRGLVINVGSASASMPPAVPLMTLYAATKKFLEKLSSDLDDECTYLTTRGREDGNDGHGVRVQCARPAYVATAMLRSANPDLRVVPGYEDDDEEDEEDDDDNYGDGCWWASRRKRVEDRFQRWLVPSARRWVRSALREGGRLYARGPDSGPANYTGYWPHTLMVWCTRLASAVTPRRWFVDRVLIPGMLVYRAKGRAAIVASSSAAAAERRSGKRTTSAAGGREVETAARRRQDKTDDTTVL